MFSLRIEFSAVHQKEKLRVSLVPDTVMLILAELLDFLKWPNLTIKVRSKVHSRAVSLAAQRNETGGHRA